MRPNFHIPSEEALRKLVPPEKVRVVFYIVSASLEANNVFEFASLKFMHKIE